MNLTRSLARTPVPVLILRIAGLEMESAARRLARALGFNRPGVLTLDDLRVPDSACARAATALAGRVESPMLFNHSLRTYLFGMAIGRHLGLRPDAELLYLGAILHDIGLTPQYDGDGSFELNSARAARDFLLAEGLPPASADTVHEAIALHAAVGIVGKREPELALLHFGAGCDVIGFHAEDVADATCEAIVAAHPRLQFKKEFAALIAGQAARKPDCHIAGHVALGFGHMIRRAPYAE